jgi:hypothetical protein
MSENNYTDWWKTTIHDLCQKEIDVGKIYHKFNIVFQTFLKYKKIVYLMFKIIIPKH